MQGDTLRQSLLAGSSAWSSGRFTPLLLNHNEYYFRRHDAVALLALPVGGDGAGGDVGAARRAALERRTGVLHLCSQSVIFEPTDLQVPVIRIPLAKVERFTPWEPDAGERASLEECGVAVADDLGASPASPAPNRSARARPTSDSGSHSSPKSRAGWFSGFTNQLLGTARSSPKSIVAPPSKTGTRPCWELCQIEAERLVTMLEDNKCTPFQTVAPLQPLLFAIKQTAAGSREDEHADPRALECSVLITLLMSDAAVKREASAAPWSPVSPLLHQLIRDHEVACLELPVPEQATSGHQRLLCRGRAVRVSPLVEIPGRFLLTDKHIWFRPFCVGEEGEEQVALTQVLRVARRRYQLQNTAIELSLKGSAAAAMYHFQSPTDCDVVWRHLSLRLQTDELREWEKIRTAWQAGAVSNYHYLMYVNSMGDRSLNDLAQYPVLPWVLADYTSETLDLQSPAAFRDLSKPMGALYQPRLARLVQRYHAMARPKFLYGTHYSAPALVLYYLVRSAPQQCLRLHGGKLDLPDRMFHSIQATWHACTTHDADVKELIPEFFNGKGDFLVNRHGLHLGMTQEGQRVSDVALPPWAQGSPAQFVALNRRALESETVSQDIHRWIDLIFGYKQRGEMSKLAFNVFHPLTYEGEVDIHSLQDETERYAVMQQISEFGQTPKQLFTEPHPRRGTGPAVPAAPTALYRYAPERAGIGRGGEEESGRRRAEIGGWGARALEQAALDQAAAVIMGAAPARTGSSQWQENEEGDEGGETGAGNAYYLRPLVEGSDSDVEPRNWTAHAILQETNRELAALTSGHHRSKHMMRADPHLDSPPSCITPCTPSEMDPVSENGRPGFVVVSRDDDVVETDQI